MTDKQKPKDNEPCGVEDCAHCWHSCIAYGPSFEHINGRPFCIIGRPVEVLSAASGGNLQEGCMKPKVHEPTGGSANDEV